MAFYSSCMKSAAKWKVRDKPGLLLAILEKLGGHVHISFEGDVRGFGLDKFPGASDKETPVLKRNTIWPKQGFLVVPLESSMGQKLLSTIGGAIPQGIIHIQIEKDGVLQFGAYDDFDPECLSWGPAFDQEFVESLVSQGILMLNRARA
jgi:hypothetical protein